MVSQFGQEEAERTCLLIKDLKIPFGGTLADLIKNTSRECITKILVEEKVCTSHWFFLLFTILLRVPTLSATLH